MYARAIAYALALVAVVVYPFVAIALGVYPLLPRTVLLGAAAILLADAALTRRPLLAAAGACVAGVWFGQLYLLLLAAALCVAGAKTGKPRRGEMP